MLSKKTLVVCVICLLALLAWSKARAGLIAEYHFDEGSGTTAADSAGSADATLVGATWTTDRFGNVGQAVQTGYNAWVNPPNTLKAEQMTLAGWIYIDSYNSTPCPIFSAERGLGTSGFAYRLQVDGTGHLVMEAVGPTTTSPAHTATSNQTLALGQWYHVAGTYDGYKSKVYIDGVFDGESVTFASYNAISTSSIIPVGIGHLENWSVQWFYGRLDELQVYDQAMAADAVALMVSGTSVPEPTSLSLLGAAGMMILRRRRR
ncbi:PEP-CTERM sorting domain-containing protein [Planctomycetales bacterium ZRK34]|nr:PEP-CTERM sorting domain-containing protein [Planctomycetales bacterium ZRK34]